MINNIHFSQCIIEKSSQENGMTHTDKFSDLLRFFQIEADE